MLIEDFLVFTIVFWACYHFLGVLFAFLKNDQEIFPQA